MISVAGALVPSVWQPASKKALISSTSSILILIFIFGKKLSYIIFSFVFQQI